MATIKCDYRDPQDDRLRCIEKTAPVVIERTGRLDDGTPYRAISRYCSPEHVPEVLAREVRDRAPRSAEQGVPVVSAG